MLRLRVLLALAGAVLANPGLAQEDDALQLRLATELNVVPADATTSARLLPLEVSINGARAGNWVLLDIQGALYAPEDAFTEWRLTRDPQLSPAQHFGQSWYPLGSVPGFEAQFKPADQSLELKFQPSAFTATRIAAQAPTRPALTPPLTALFANYDLSYTRTSGETGSGSDLGAITELGISGRAGVLTSSFVGRNLAGAETGTPSWKRLETTYVLDFPETSTVLRLGDTVTRAPVWGRSVYYGGVQWARNYASSPGFITQPIPVVAGRASAPSVVELYINDALRQTSQVPSGPFTIENAPLLTGSGQARLVVRDLLGRETVVVQNLFTHAALLRAGLADWSIEAGAVRNNLGVDSASYGERFGAGLLRYGLTDGVTLEGRAELGQETRGAGGALAVALPWQTLAQVGLAASHDGSAGNGTQWLALAEHASLRHGFTVRAQGASREYREIGQNAGTLPYKLQTLASYSYAATQAGHLGLAYGNVETYDNGSFRTQSASYSHRIGRGSSLTFTATRVSGPAAGNSIGVALLIPLDRGVAGAASFTRRGGETEGYASASRSIGLETGSAWRALAGHRLGREYAEGGWYYQGGKGMVTADVSASDAQQAVRLGAQGGLVFADRELFASRKVLDSFAVIEVPGYADVGVGFQSSVLARTDEAGRALLPRLMAYRANSIRLDPSELPISAELDTIEAVVVPPLRSGVKVTFPVRAGRAALLTIVLDDGAPAPAGAEIALAGDEKEFFVARRGEAFITGLLDKTNVLTLKWQGQQCRIAVELPRGKADEIARLGPYTCAGVKQ